MSKTGIDKKIMYFDLNKKRFPGFTLGFSRQKRLLKMKINDIPRRKLSKTIKQLFFSLMVLVDDPCLFFSSRQQLGKLHNC
jgi:hypothetical protein